MCIKKSIGVFFSLFLVLSMVFPVGAFASSSGLSEPISHEQYQKAVDADMIDSEISYKTICELFNTQPNLDNSLSKNSDFKCLDNSIQLEPGDIIIANTGNYYGMFGHAGIAIGPNEILHIPGFNTHPQVDTPQDFVDHHGLKWVKAYRLNNTEKARMAADWAVENYKDSGAKYKITFNLKSTDTTYCSKIVWQAYFFGAGYECMPLGKYTPTYGLSHPYMLPIVLNKGDYKIDCLGDLKAQYQD